MTRVGSKKRKRKAMVHQRIAEIGKKEKRKKKRPKKQTVAGYIDNAPVPFFRSPSLTDAQRDSNHWRIVELRPFSLFYTRVEYLYTL